MPKYGNIETQAQYAVVTLENLLLSGALWEDIIADIDEVYDQAPDPEGANNDYGDPSKWEAFMRAYPSFVFCLIRNIRNEEKIVAYWYTLPVKKALYDRGVAGENINAELTNVHIEDFSVPGDYYLYLVDLFRFEGVNNRAANTKLIQSFAEFLIDSYNDGFSVCGIFANTSTPWAINLCERLGFKFRCEHKQHKMAAIEGGDQGALQPTIVCSIELDEADVVPYANGLLKRWAHPAKREDLKVNLDSAHLKGIIASDEQRTVEFKGKIDLKNDHLQEEFLIAISSFLNTDGGLLFIGVKNDRSIIGIDRSISSYQDKYKRDFEQIIVNRLGPLFLPCITQRIVDIDGKPVHVFECKKGPRESHIRYDRGVTKFYIRGDNSCRQLIGTEVTDYIKVHFS
jgi:hypothetical protein